MKIINQIIQNLVLATGILIYAFAAEEEISVGIIPCIDKSGGQVTSIAAGQYSENYVKTGSVSDSYSTVEDGKKLNHDERHDIYEIQVPKKVQYERGAYRLPDNAAEALTASVCRGVCANPSLTLITNLPIEVQQWATRRIENNYLPSEQEGRRTDSLIDEAPKSEWSVLTSSGAQFLLVPEILSFEINEKVSQGYGVERRVVEKQMMVAAYLINTQSRQIVSSETKTVRRRKELPQGTLRDDSIYSVQDLIEEAGNSIVHSLFTINTATRLRKNAECTARKSKSVEICVISTPQGASVDFLGKYYGTTPCRIEVPVQTAELIIKTSQGEWRRMITPYQGMEIKATLSSRRAPNAPHGGTTINVNHF